MYFQTAVLSGCLFMACSELLGPPSTNASVFPAKKKKWAEMVKEMQTLIADWIFKTAMLPHSIAGV